MQTNTSFKRLSPYAGANIPEWVREYGEELWDNPSPDHEPGQWKWDDGSGTYQCELLLCDLESLLLDPAGYVAIVPLEDPRIDLRIEGERCWIRCVLDEKFQVDAKTFGSRIFDSFAQAKAVLDVALAFKTPEIPAANL
jgi:hypothetical protein